MELLLPGRFDDPGTAYAYQRTIFEEVAAGERCPTVSITPSTHHVGVTRRDTLRPGYDEAAPLVLGAFARLDIRDAEIGEVRDEFCPGDHSIRAGDFEDGMKLVGIAQRVTKRATSVGGIVLVRGERELAQVLSRIYAAMNLPMRYGSVGSLRRNGSGADIEDVIGAFAEEAKLRYGATSVPLDERTLWRARKGGAGNRIPPPFLATLSFAAGGRAAAG